MTITYTPIQYASVNDDLIYTVEDAAKVADPITYPNFKFIGDVYIGATLVARLKKVPDPVTGIGIFNVGQIVRSYMTTHFNPILGLLVAQVLADTEFRLTVQMKFGEEYSYTDTLNIVVDIQRTYFNNYDGRGGGLNTSLFLFPDKVASFRPLVTQVLRSSNYNLIPYFPTTTAAVNVIVTPAGGGIVYSDTFTPANAYDLQVLNIAPGNLNVLQPGTITSATTSYTVQIGTETFTFNIICEAIHTPNVLYFLNKLGGFESKVFTKVSRYTVDITRASFGRQRYTVSASGIVDYANSNKVYNESTSVYAVQYKEKKIFNSDILSDDEYSWLQDLILSPIVYHEELNGDFFPVVITETNYEQRKVINDDLTNLTVTVEYGQNLNSQIR